MLAGGMAVLTIAAMAVCLWKADARNRRIWYILCFLLCCANAVCVRLQQTAAPEALFPAAVLKFCASLPTVVLAYTGYRSEKNRADRLLLLAIVLCLAADVSINLSFIAGGAIFLIGHLFFDAAFIRMKKPEKKQWIQLAVTAAGGAVLLAVFYKRMNSPVLFFGALIYLVILFSTLILSFRLDRRLFAAAAVFAVSDALMAINMVTNAGMAMRILALLVYYGALILYGIAIWELRHPDPES